MRRLKRMALPAAVGLALYFAVLGGEHSWLDVRRATRARAAEAAELEALRQEIDSLASWAEALEGDPETLERLARERYGMIRDGEVLYRFAEPPDSVATPTEDAP